MTHLKVSPFDIIWKEKARQQTLKPSIVKRSMSEAHIDETAGPASVNPSGWTCICKS